jgi:putative peptidoglycan lipid II flippase
MTETQRYVNNGITLNVQLPVKFVTKHGLLRSTVIFGSMTFISRIAGFIRDILQASLFGTGVAVSAFVVAYRIPNYLRRIFAEGSFSSAFVPVLSELREQGDQEKIQDFLNHIAGALLATVLMVTALGMFLSPWIARVFLAFASHDTERIALTAQMLRITFPYLVFISMTALAGAVLNSYRKFALPAFTPVLHNLGVIAGMLFLAQFFEEPAFALAWGVFIAGFLQFCLLWPSLGRLGLRPSFRLNFQHKGVRRVFGLMLPTIFSSSVAQINLLVDTVFASLLVTNAQSWLYYSDRLTEFPLGLFGVAVGTVILPHLSSYFANKDTEGYSRALDWGLRLVLLLSIPAALGLMLLSEPLTATLYHYGKFTAEDTRMVSYSVIAMSVAIPAFMLSKILLPAFYSRHDTKTPMRIAVYTVLMNAGLTVIITTPLWRNGVQAAHAGIALGTAIAGIFNTYMLWRCLWREGIYQPQVGWKKLIVQILCASILMSIAVLSVRFWVGSWLPLHGMQRLLYLLLAIAAGGAVYLGSLFAMGLRIRHLREV